MSKIVIITCDIAEAEAVSTCLERIRNSYPAGDSVSGFVKLTVSFNSKLVKAIKHTKGVKQRVGK